MQACRKTLIAVAFINYQEITAICRQNGNCKCKIFLNLDDNFSKNQTIQRPWFTAGPSFVSIYFKPLLSGI